MTIRRFFANKYITALSAGFIGMAVSNPAPALINMESVHLGVPDPGFSGTANLGLSGASGNSERVLASVNSRLQYYTEQKTSFLIFDYAYGESFSRKDQNKMFLHSRRIRDIDETWAWELFGQVESNEFARLKYRGLLGGGMRASLIPRSKEQGLFIGIGGFYDYEDVSVEGNTTDSGVTHNYFANAYIVFKRKISNTATFVNTTYLQPRFNDTRDFRAFEAAKLNVAIINNLSLNLNLEIVHDNRPPQAVKKTDVSYSTSLQIQF